MKTEQKDGVDGRVVDPMAGVFGKGLPLLEERNPQVGVWHPGLMCYVLAFSYSYSNKTGHLEFPAEV